MNTATFRRHGALGLVIAAVVAPALAGAAGAAGAEERAMTTNSSTQEASNRSLVSGSFERWRDGSGSPFDLLAEDARWTIVGRSAAAGTYASREDFMTRVIRPFNARMQSGLKPTVRHIYADGATVIVFFHAAAVARDGQPYENTYTWILDMDEGRISNAIAFFDSIEFDELWQRVPPGE